MFTYAAIFPNGKKYIGATTRTVEKRKEEHRDSSTRVDNKFYRAINKYGFENVEFREIKEHATKEEMFKEEKILIDRHKTQTEGYNTTSGGEGCPNIIYTPEIRKNISEGQKKRFSNPDELEIHANRKRQWFIDNPIRAEEIKQKIGVVLRTDEHRLKASENQRKFLENNPDAAKETGKKISEKFKNDPSYRLKISQTLGGSPIRVFKEGEEVAVYLTLSSLCKDMNLNIGNVGACFTGKRNHVHGYTFVKDDTVELL